MKKLVHLGWCRRPHGLKGGLFCSLSSGRESILKKGMKVTLIPENSSSELPAGGKCYQIRDLRLEPKGVIYFDHVFHRESAQALLPFGIFLGRQDFPPLEEGEFYFNDLLGLTVIDSTTKEKIGVVKGISHNTAQGVLEVRGKVNRDLPFVEVFFPTVDWEKGIIEMVVPEIIES